MLDIDTVKVQRNLYRLFRAEVQNLIINSQIKNSNCENCLITFFMVSQRS